MRAGRPGGAGTFPTGLTLGDGGIASARPRRGVRGPERLPGRAGRRSGTGADILGTDDPCDGNSRVGCCGCMVERNRKRLAKDDALSHSKYVVQGGSFGPLEQAPWKECFFFLLLNGSTDSPDMRHGRTSGAKSATGIGDKSKRNGNHSGVRRSKGGKK